MLPMPCCSGGLSLFVVARTTVALCALYGTLHLKERVGEGARCMIK